ncbi:MAG: hypothetical protein JW936_05635 [Sedimentisphaerales bacterium]|nr:hypothetical protein [Sedimentisphaerales bacterium]
MDQIDISRCNRINVVGTSGSGKTTFAKLLSDKLEIKHIEIDAVFWGPDWHLPSDDEFLPKLEKVLSENEKWVLDGNYTRAIPIKWKDVDLVIWLDYSFPRTFLQAIKRAVTRSITKEELWEGTGNRESFKGSFFSKNSIILWTIQTYHKTRRAYERILKDSQYSQIQFLRFRSPRESARFIAGIEDHRAKG